ncbi:MAG: nucleotidyltransferase substrate binding protein [bacterium]
MIGKKLTNTFNQMERMLHTLEESTTLYANKTKVFSTHEQDDKVLNIYSDSVIKRFEYCVNNFWELLKTYLKNTKGLHNTKRRPQFVAHKAATYGLLSKEESCQFITMIEQRNKIPCTYKQEIADEIARFAPQGLVFMKTILARLQNHYTIQKDLS